MTLLDFMNPKTYGLNAAEAAIVLGILGVAVSKLRGHTVTLWRLVKSLLFVEVEISHRSDAVTSLVSWITENEKHTLFKPRRFAVSSRSSGSLQTTMGYGTQWYRVPNLGLVSLTKAYLQNQDIGFVGNTAVVDVACTFQLRVWFRSDKVVTQLLTAMEDTYVKHNRSTDDRIAVGGCWEARPARARRIETITLPNKQCERILNNARKFFQPETKEFYANAGIPYRRGFLFYGPPGTGKTSLARALRTELAMPLYVINLSSVASDSELLRLVSSVKPKSLILCEDVDIAQAVQARSEAPQPDAEQERDGEHGMNIPIVVEPDRQLNNSTYRGVTLNGVLDALDGVHTPEDVIFLLSTNHVEKLDRALIRDGRCDLHEYVGPLTPALQWEQLTRILSCQEQTMPEWFNQLRGVEACKIQGIILRNWLEEPATAYQRTLDELLRVYINKTQQEYKEIRLVNQDQRLAA